MEFETLIKIIVALAASFFIPIAAYAAVAGIRTIGRGSGPAPGALQEHVDALEARVAQLEAEHDRVLELEERVDFAERMLARGREEVDSRPPLPGS